MIRRDLLSKMIVAFCQKAWKIVQCSRTNIVWQILDEKHRVLGQKLFVQYITMSPHYSSIFFVFSCEV